VQSVVHKLVGCIINKNNGSHKINPLWQTMYLIILPTWLSKAFVDMYNYANLSTATVKFTVSVSTAQMHVDIYAVYENEGKRDHSHWYLQSCRSNASRIACLQQQIREAHKTLPRMTMHSNVLLNRMTTFLENLELSGTDHMPGKSRRKSCLEKMSMAYLKFGALSSV